MVSKTIKRRMALQPALLFIREQLHFRLIVNHPLFPSRLFRQQRFPGDSSGGGLKYPTGKFEWRSGLSKLSEIVYGVLHFKPATEGTGKCDRIEGTWS
jgi:hypothetical protein